MNDRTHRSAERGAAIVMTILVLLAVSALATAMIIMSQGDHLVSANERDAEQALFAAKSGLSYAFKLFSDGTLVPTVGGAAFDSFDTAVTAALKGGEFTGTIFDESVTQGQLYRIVSTGTVNNSTRTTELVFQLIPEAFKYGYMGFNEATLHNHSGLAGPSFKIESTIFSNGEVKVPKDLTLDGAIVSTGAVTIESGSTVRRDVFANSLDNDGTVNGKVTLLTAVESLPSSATSWDRLDAYGSKYDWFDGNSSPGSVSGGGTIVGATSSYTIADGDEFNFTIFRNDGGLLPDPDLNVTKYIDPPMLDYPAMKREADKDDATYFTSMAAAAQYFGTKKVTEVIDGKTMVTVRVGTTAAPEYIYVDDDFALTLDPDAGGDNYSNGLLKAHGFHLEGGIYSTGTFEVFEPTFDPAVYPAPPLYYAFSINGLDHCYPAVIAYEEPSSGTFASWTPADTPPVGGGSKIGMKSGSPHGGFVFINGLTLSQADTHLHHTKSSLELIRFNGAELAYKIHNCDYFHFTYDPDVRCTRFLVADAGTPEIVSYREVR